MSQLKLDYGPFVSATNTRISTRVYDVIDKYGNVVGQIKGDTLVAFLKQDCFTVTDDNPTASCLPSPCDCY